MRCFLTGIDGFAASHLGDRLLETGDNEVGGTAMPGVSLANIEHQRDRIAVYAADLLDADSLAKALSAFYPDVVFHLAAVSFVPSDPERVRRVNVDGSRNLLAAMRDSCLDARGVFISSSEVYGAPPKGAGPLDESYPIAPVSAYAESKVRMEESVRSYREKYGMDLVILRPFNHIGPRQSPEFVVSSFCRQIAEIEAGRQEPVLAVGNLTPKRDFTDVRDMVWAYALAASHAKSGDVFNLASGESRSIQSILDLLIRRSQVDVRVVCDPSRVRPVDIPDIAGDSRAFEVIAGWRPKIPFEQTLEDTLAFWRGKI